MNAIRVATIRYEAAECCGNCKIGHCAYMHFDAWFVDCEGKEYGPFWTAAEAAQTKQRLEK